MQVLEYDVEISPVFVVYKKNITTFKNRENVKNLRLQIIWFFSPRIACVYVLCYFHNTY